MIHFLHPATLTVVTGMSLSALRRQDPGHSTEPRLTIAKPELVLLSRLVGRPLADEPRRHVVTVCMSQRRLRD